jgi:hypothetical protein
MVPLSDTQPQARAMTPHYRKERTDTHHHFTTFGRGGLCNLSQNLFLVGATMV